MPNSPRIDFNFINNNIEVTKPVNGISLILARTKSGPVADPSEIITSVTKFRQKYGAEIVPDGSPSNIEKALKGGSKLRILRVVGTGYTDGNVYFGTETDTEDGVVFVLNLGTTNKVNFKLNLTGPSAAIIKNQPGTVYVKLYGDNYGQVYYAIYTDTATIATGTLFSVYMDGSKASIDTDALKAFNSKDQYFDLEFTIPSSLTEFNPGSSIKELADYIDTHINGTSNTVSVTPPSGVATIYTGWVNTVDKGNQGSTPTITQWENAIDVIRDYQDIYEVSVSNIYQHLNSSEAIQLHSDIATIASECQEFQYFVEIPKYKLNGSSAGYTSEVMNKSDIITWLTSTRGSIGNSMFVCYFGGGIKYYDSTGILCDSEVIGTIHGLADSCAAKFGPYRSFAGMNRGVIEDGQGPVCPNYGAPSRYDDLNELALAGANMIVLKSTRTSGLATTLWHSFTSHIKQDSFRYINSVRLALFIKKQLRPILESYIEEPNIWSSWKRIYLEGKPIMDDLIEDEAISEYTWDGDQDATSWEELTVNNEADVRNGKYKLNIKVKDVATMQDIKVNLIYDQASNTVSSAITSV